MTLENKYFVGDIVTFKTHPLLYDLNIKGDGKLVPPFMVVREVLFEDKKKKVVDDVTGMKIGERIKYNCVFFDDNRCEFNEVMIYETMLQDFTKFYIARMDGKKKSDDEYESLLTEVSKYSLPAYNYGNLVYFKTKKLEIYKKRSSKRTEIIGGKKEERETIQYVVNYSTPEFILCGYKKEFGTDLFYPNGEKKKLVSEVLFKVKWFNSSQMKFSEQYLPMECFIDKQPFKTKVPHNEEEVKPIKSNKKSVNKTEIQPSSKRKSKS